MKRAEEHEAFASVVGSYLRKEKLNEFTVHSRRGIGEYADCEEYVFEDLDHLNEKLIHIFRITDALMAKWKTAGILFRFCLFVRDGTITGGHILKYKISLDERCCDAGYETAPTQQEIRITDRILKYLIEENL